MKTVRRTHAVRWKVHTPNLLGEVLNNPEARILSIPINILGKLLAQVADRAAQLNDLQLNALMIRLTLYSVADPLSSDYDAETCHAILAAAQEEKGGYNDGSNED